MRDWWRHYTCFEAVEYGGARLRASASNAEAWADVFMA